MASGRCCPIGAAAELADVDVAWLDGVSWLHVPSYSLLAEPIGTATRQLIVELGRRDGRLSVDVSSVAVVEQYGVERYRALLDDVAPDVVFANEPESHVLDAGGGAVLIVKDGPRPVRIRGLDRCSEVDVPPLRASSTRPGPGTRSPAGYLAAAIRGDGVRDAVAAGITLRGERCSVASGAARPGSRPADGLSNEPVKVSPSNLSDPVPKLPSMAWKSNVNSEPSTMPPPTNVVIPKPTSLITASAPNCSMTSVNPLSRPDDQRPPLS